jgi:hypothetical protein
MDHTFEYRNKGIHQLKKKSSLAVVARDGAGESEKVEC